MHLEVGGGSIDAVVQVGLGGGGATDTVVHVGVHVGD